MQKRRGGLALIRRKPLTTEDGDRLEDYSLGQMAPGICSRAARAETEVIEADAKGETVRLINDGIMLVREVLGSRKP